LLLAREHRELLIGRARSTARTGPAGISTIAGITLQVKCILLI
jgi:hypothetical protein